MNPSTDSFTVNIAEMPVTLVLAECDDATRARILDRYSAFAATHAAAMLSIRLRVEPGAAFIPIGNSPYWQIRTAERDGRIEFESYFERGWADRISGEGELLLRPEGDAENYLRVLYAWLCLEQPGLVLHASGIISNGKGYVFFGASGSGKTTVSRLSLDRTVLSDDLVIVKKHNGVYRLYGVPFRGDFPEAPRHNASADLRGLFTLVKDTDHFVAPMEITEAAARLASCAPFVMAQAQSAQRVLRICADLAAQIPVRALHFRRDAGFWEVIDGLD